MLFRHLKFLGVKEFCACLVKGCEIVFSWVCAAQLPFDRLNRIPTMLVAYFVLCDRCRGLVILVQVMVVEKWH